MKKNYITPKINLAKANIEYSVCTASINNAGEITPSTDIDNLDDTDKPFDPGAKNRFYGDSDDSWE